MDAHDDFVTAQSILFAHRFDSSVFV